MSQYGFFFDQSRCWGCQCCAVACKSWNRLPPGPLKYLKVYEYEKGSFPDLRVHFQWVPCYHCEEPACLTACPEQAIYKETTYGAVLIDHRKCNGCRLCYEACPYGAPVFEDGTAGARKCTMCIDRLKAGLLPICVVACPARALDCGPLTSLTAVYGDNGELEDMPGSQMTRPAVIFKPHSAKRRLVSYPIDKALRLNRGLEQPTPGTQAVIVPAPSQLVGRDRLVLKHPSVEKLMYHTRNDEG